MATRKKTKKKATRKKKTTARKAPARKKAAKKTAKRASAKKKTTRKAAGTKKKTKKKAKKKRAAAKKTTAAELRQRAAEAEIEIKTEAPPAQGPEAMQAALGGLALPNIDLENMDLSGIQDSVKGIVDFVEENPVAAAAVALGAGVVLTSMYWDKSGGKK